MLLIMFDGVAQTLPTSLNKTALRLLPTNGKGRGGVRSSRLLMNNASPPSGCPVSVSRGPAWLMPKPRCEVAPPERKRSGRGMKLEGGGAVGPGAAMAELVSP